MAVLSLPLTFTNSFWSQEYRRGLEVLFEKLNQGVEENAEIVAFIRARAVAEAQLAVALTNPMLTGASGTGFSADDGASLLMTFRGLQAESLAQGLAHKSISKELDTLVADPFDQWAESYKERLGQCKSTVIDNWLKSYELAQGDVAKLKHQYLSKVRRADEAEDDAKFAPNTNGVADNYTTSPRIRPHDGRTPPVRTASVSERIAQRLKEIQKKGVGALATTSEEHKSETAEEKEPLKTDKGKGKAIEELSTSPLPASPPPMSPPLPPSKADIRDSISPVPPMPPSPMLLAGLSLPPSAVSDLLTRAAAQLPLRPVRFPLLGEYQDCFTGEEFVTWLNENVQGFGGSLDRAEDAAKDLTEREGLLRRIGELGNQFEHSDDAFYQFRPKAFDLEGKNLDVHSSSSAIRRNSLQPENLIKRTNNFVSLVSKALNPNTHGEPTHIKARHDAEEADKMYRVAVRKLDRQRLGLEEGLEETLKTLQRWELERLRAVKTVLLQYQGTLANLPKSLEPSIERSGTLIAAYQPESDLTALIERYRTGPFKPEAQVYESVSHDECDVVFGIDLRKWAEGGWTALTSGEEKKDLVHPVLTALLNGLNDAYGRLPNDTEKRKSWIYEVPLSAVHHLREVLNAIPPEQPIPAELFTKYDAPVIAGTIKLWLLELNPSLTLSEGWENFRRLYPTVGSAAAKMDSEATEEQRIRELRASLQRLPRVHLHVLDAIVSHLKKLIDTTTVEEPNEVYITKLALSLGRCIIRPKFESEISIQDRHPTLLCIDLVQYYAEILPPTIASKKRESERKIPIRKRTAMVDMRLSRSRISLGADAQQLLAAQQLAQNPSLSKTTHSPELSHAAPAFTQPAPPPVPHVVKPVVEASLPPPPAPARAPAVPSSDVTATRPSFKPPPPEDDDLPPRPAFKDPPPELDDDDAVPQIPKFAEPKEPETSTPPPVAPSSPSPTTAVTPPTSQRSTKRNSALSYSSGGSSPTKISLGSRSPSPGRDDSRPSVSRSSSAQSTGVRGPRLTRGPRAPAGNNVGNLVSNLNRNSVGSTSPGGLRSGSPGGLKRVSSPSGGGRPGSVLGRSAPFSRRTMASDAEDDVVEKK